MDPVSISIISLQSFFSYFTDCCEGKFDLQNEVLMIRCTLALSKPKLRRLYFKDVHEQPSVCSILYGQAECFAKSVDTAHTLAWRA